MRFIYIGLVPRGHLSMVTLLQLSVMIYTEPNNPTLQSPEFRSFLIHARAVYGAHAPPKDLKYDHDFDSSYAGG